jgi:hypothetical protein
MNSLLTVVALDILLTSGVVDAPPWIYMLLVCGTFLVFSLPLPGKKEAEKFEITPKIPDNLEPIEKNEKAPEAWDYDYSVYHCKFDVV